MIYYSQGAFYSEGSWASRITLVFILIISIYYFIYANRFFLLPKPMRILSILVMVFTIYGVIPLLFGVENVKVNVNSFQFLKFIFLSFLPIYTFYVFWKKNWLDETTIRRWFVIFLFVVIGGFYYSNKKLLAMAMSVGSSAEEFTNNEGYTVLSLICLLPLFNKKPLIQYGLLTVCMAYVLMGYKRGAITASGFCVLWFVIQTFKMDKAKEKKTIYRQIIRIVLVFGIVFGAIYGVQYLFSESEYFNQRVDSTMSGQSSGRDVYYSFFLNHIYNETKPLRLLFGYGAYGTLVLFGDSAHNDWLEIAIDNGLIVVLIYVGYWISLFTMFFKGKRTSTSTTILGLFVILYFMKTIYSMSYTTVTPYASCALAYAMAYYEHKDKIRSIR